MKKFLPLVILLALTLILVSCVSDKTDPAEPTGQEETQTPKDPPKINIPPPSPKPIITFEPVHTFNFDEPDNIGWRMANHLENFRVEDGMLKMTSNGGDPFFQTISPLNIEAEEIEAIRIKVKNMSGNNKCQLFFDTSIESGFSESKSYKESYFLMNSREDDDEWNEVVFYTEDCILWEGTIKHVRFDPLESAGDVWIEYISFDKIITTYPGEENNEPSGEEEPLDDEPSE